MNSFLQYIKNLSPTRVISLVAIAIFLISFLAYIVTRLSAPKYAILYTDLDLEDAKQIVSRLDSENVKYKLENNGTEILVPEKLVNKMRVNTAELALTSKGSNVGYEIFDNTDALGSTNFVQNVNLIRALEGELARTIRSVDNIKSARVHLVLPKREIFSKEEQDPTASVFIRTKRGKLEISNIQSIQKLVSAAVPKLEPKNVAIIDGAGNLLTNNYEDSEALSTANNEMLKREQEKKMAANVQSLLEKTVGAGKVRAQVSLDMDFDQVVTNEEIYDPDSQVVRSASTITEEGSSGEPEDTVSVSQNIPNGDTISSGNGYSQNSRTEEVLNYEISKTVRNKVKSSGTVKRLSVAVMIDGVYEKNAAGEETYRDRTADEIEKLAVLVKSAIGFDADRGDVVEVENMKFVTADVSIAEEAEILVWGFNKSELLKMAEGLGVAIVAILIILLVVKPLINNAFEGGQTVGESPLVGEGGSPDENLLLSNFLNDEEGGEELINLKQIEGRVKVSSLKKLNEMVMKDPDTTVNILRSWMYRNENNG